MTGKDIGDKRGRARRYDFTAAPEFRHPLIGFAVAALDELLERVVDQVDDLPPEAFRYVSPGGWFCLGWLPLHLAVSEYNVIRKMAARLGQEPVSAGAELETLLRYGALQSDGTTPENLKDARLLVDTMRTVRSEVTLPVCRTIRDPEETLPDAERLSTPRNVLMHLLWHWTYHSGHIGLMRLEWGSDYEWVMAPPPQT